MVTFRLYESRNGDDGTEYLHVPAQRIRVRCEPEANERVGKIIPEQSSEPAMLAAVEMTGSRPIARLGQNFHLLFVEVESVPLSGSR
ncbi:MAG: hypothetical protein WD401_04000 [Thermomicrobiaceae bacterium]